MKISQSPYFTFVTHFYATDYLPEVHWDVLHYFSLYWFKKKRKTKSKVNIYAGAWTYKIMKDRMLCNEGSLYSLHSQICIISPRSSCFSGRSSTSQFSGEQRYILKLSTKKYCSLFLGLFFSNRFLLIPNKKNLYSCLLPEQYLNIFNDDISQII